MGAQRERDASSFISVQSDEGLTVLDQSIAGAVANGATKFALYPIDTLKARLQASRSSNLAEFNGMWTVAGVYRGIVPKIALYVPYQALYMAVYVQARDRLVHCPWPIGNGGAMAFVFSGVIAEVAASIVRLPMEVAKLRLQLGLYRNSWHALQELVHRPWTFYGNFVPQTLAHDCVYSACSWFIFETSRQHIFAQRSVKDLPAHESLMLGTATGAVSALVTTPMDVLKTRVVGDRFIGATAATERMVSARSLVQLASRILQEEGPRTFFRGAWWRVAHLAPAHGVYMLLYEIAKGQIGLWHGLSR